MGIATFASQAISEFQSTAAIAPSSRFLVEAMVQPLPMDRVKTMVELGPGTGAMTEELLAQLPRDAKLFAFEINPRFVQYLRANLSDPRLEVIECGAERADEELARRGVHKADAVLSSLGLSLLPDSLIEEIFAAVFPLLAQDGVFTQFQYVTRMRLQDGRAEYFDVGDLLRRHFPRVQRRMIVRNLPPAFVYDCRLR
ncbi:MAG: methyltransferase domain-containing protein [Acidobacteria bacterium]|nr:methyltransferase domain-containing protein [Acidobacteriota bacterium]